MKDKPRLRNERFDMRLGLIEWYKNHEKKIDIISITPDESGSWIIWFLEWIR